ncbi:MAG: thioredoxin family protein, partial [Bacteroidales bacterium]|nr:thioredoxin family protein [Bacteroidales bacterium]
MKKSIFTIIVLLASVSVLMSQQIARDKVVVEIGTGTWCPYCPGAAMGADDLVANGHDVAIIENHNGDDYTNSASNARNSYYGISGYPTALFDGGSAYVGGSNGTSLYPQYLSR